MQPQRQIHAAVRGISDAIAARCYRQRRSVQIANNKKKERATPVGFEPMRGDPIGLAGRRLNRPANVPLVAISIRPLTGNTYTRRTETRQLLAAFALQMDN